MSEDAINLQRIPRRDFCKTITAAGTLWALTAGKPCAASQTIQRPHRRKVYLFGIFGWS